MSEDDILDDDNFSDGNIPDWVVGTGIAIVFINFIIFGLVPWTIGICKMCIWIF